MKVAIVKETFPGERRVALVPADVAKLAKNGLSVIVESQAGDAAGFLDAAYQHKGAEIALSREAALAADIVLQIRANHHGRQIVIGMCDPLGEPQSIADFAASGSTLFALELIPRTTRAQSMDV